MNPEKDIDKIEMTREELIEILLDDDFDAIVNQYCTDYLYNILRLGFVGYEKMTNEQLIQEYYNRMTDCQDVELIDM